MILIEYIQGTTMEDAKPILFSQSARQYIMKAIVDLESRIYEKNIWLIDLESRNILIRYTVDSQLQIVFIDFGDALFNC